MTVVKNGLTSQATRTTAVIAAMLSILTSSYYVGEKLARIEESIKRREDKQIQVIKKLDLVDGNMQDHVISEGHPALVEKVANLKDRVRRLEGSRDDDGSKR